MIEQNADYDSDESSDEEMEYTDRLHSRVHEEVAYGLLFEHTNCWLTFGIRSARGPYW